jgi:hypothetical protein
MLIKVYGSGSKHLKTMAREATMHAANSFFDKRILENLEISLKFDSELLATTGDVAQMEWMDSHVRSRVFGIYIDSNLSSFLKILSIMHEMVHVKQYAKGELFQSLKDGSLHKWNRKEWINEEKMSYWELPWEIEAHGREKGLMVSWLNATDLISEKEKQNWRAKFMFA